MKKERFVYRCRGDLKIGEGTFFHYSGLKIYVMKIVNWVTFESTTGIPLCWAKTKKEVVEKTKEQLETKRGKEVEYEIKFGAGYLEKSCKVRQFKIDNDIQVD